MSTPINTGGDPNYQPGNFSKAHESKITSPDEDKIKQEKAKALIDEIVSDKLLPIEAQIKELPNLIYQTVTNVITDLQQKAAQENQPIQQVAPQQGTDTEKLKALGELAGVVAPIFGKGEQPQNNQLQEMIMNSFAKMIQAKVDETVMSTYQTPVHPPSWVTSREPSVQRPKIQVE